MDKPPCLTSKNVESQKHRTCFSLRGLRLSLKYRPEILKLVLKMRQTIKMKNALLNKLKRQLKKSFESKDTQCTQANLDPSQIKGHIDSLSQGSTNLYDKNNSYTQTIVEETDDFGLLDKNERVTKDSCTQTENFDSTKKNEPRNNDSNEVSSSGWDIQSDGEKTKSIADQVKEVAQNALQQTGMVYVETAGMYYDYKTGYYYNSSFESKDTQCTQANLDPSQIKGHIDSLSQGSTNLYDKNNSYTQTIVEETDDFGLLDKNERVTKDSCTQTENFDSTKKNEPRNNDSNEVSSSGWDIQSDGEKTKSIADQVKEVAQNALQQTGMVYVETAGMYYDYKTGYYYNSELGLYYHTDTGCYYYYSDEKQTFVFHSYPDKSGMKEPSKSQEVKKAIKKKKAQPSDDIENLTKQLNQDKEDGQTKPKRRKIKDAKKTQEKPSKKLDQEEENVVSDKEKEEILDTSVQEKEEILDTFVQEKEEENDLKRELEDGECSDTASEESDGAVSDASTSTASDDESVAKHHPPCMRIIVRETSLAKLKVGSLYLITKDGGTIGREGDNHAIVLRDHNVSRNHLHLKFDMEERAYFAVDLGSKNGTLLNGSRMSESQQTSEPIKVVHGSTIQLGETKLLCHIHAGNDTCGHCEPGLIMETQEKEKKVAYTRTCSVQKQHQLELARLKNLYAPKRLEIEETAYNDRAQARREKVGSSHHSEKTQSSDINTFIAPENKGFKLLEKMGWSKGEGLGKDSQGDQEPIPLVGNEGTTGLGSTSVPKVVASKTLGPATLRLAAKTKMLQPPAKAFQQVEEDSD